MARFDGVRAGRRHATSHILSGLYSRWRRIRHMGRARSDTPRYHARRERAAGRGDMGELPCASYCSRFPMPLLPYISIIQLMIAIGVLLLLDGIMLYHDAMLKLKSASPGFTGTMLRVAKDATWHKKITYQ